MLSKNARPAMQLHVRRYVKLKAENETQYLKSETKSEIYIQNTPNLYITYKSRN